MNGFSSYGYLTDKVSHILVQFYGGEAIRLVAELEGVIKENVTLK